MRCVCTGGVLFECPKFRWMAFLLPTLVYIYVPSVYIIRYICFDTWFVWFVTPVGQAMLRAFPGCCLNEVRARVRTRASYTHDTVEVLYLKMCFACFLFVCVFPCVAVPAIVAARWILAISPRPDRQFVHTIDRSIARDVNLERSIRPSLSPLPVATSKNEKM